MGAWVLFAPASSLPVLAYAFAIGMIAAAVLDLGYAIAASGFHSQWGWGLASGILEMMAGIWLLSMPEAQLVTCFMIIVGIWILVAAINSIAEICVLSAFSAGWLVWSILLLTAAIVLAVFFLTTPLFGGIAVWLWIGISLICYGVFRLVMAARLRSVGRLAGR